jgi:hypothetical protein
MTTARLTAVLRAWWRRLRRVEPADADSTTSPPEIRHPTPPEPRAGDRVRAYDSAGRLIGWIDQTTNTLELKSER